MDDASYPSLESILALNVLIQTVRDLLDNCCTVIGAKRNADKSEVICSPDIMNKILLGKNKFVWLGYSFQLVKRDILIFTVDKIIGKSIKLAKTCARMACLGLSYSARLKVYNVYIRPIFELFCINYNILGEVKKQQISLIKKLFKLPKSMSTSRIFEFLRIHTAEELFAKQASIIYNRNQSRCESLVMEDASMTRSGKPRLKEVGENEALRRDFFTKIMGHKNMHDQETYARFKELEPRTELELCKWAIKWRKRIQLIVRKSKARRRK